MTDLRWHCFDCGAHEAVAPTGDGDEYAMGDKEPCISCGHGTAHVVTLRTAARYEQGLAMGLDRDDARVRALAAPNV